MISWRGNSSPTNNPEIRSSGFPCFALTATIKRDNPPQSHYHLRRGYASVGRRCRDNIKARGHCAEVDLVAIHMLQSAAVDGINRDVGLHSVGETHLLARDGESRGSDCRIVDGCDVADEERRADELLLVVSRGVSHLQAHVKPHVVILGRHVAQVSLIEVAEGRHEVLGRILHQGKFLPSVRAVGRIISLHAGRSSAGEVADVWIIEVFDVGEVASGHQHLRSLGRLETVADR